MTSNAPLAIINVWSYALCICGDKVTLNVTGSLEPLHKWQPPVESRPHSPRTFGCRYFYHTICNAYHPILVEEVCQILKN